MRIPAALCLMLVACIGPARAQPAHREPLVLAAASLKTALDAVVADWKRGGGAGARVSYAGSPALVRQLEHGAPADLLFLADTDWMDYAAGKGLVARDTQRDLLGNALVLIAPAGTARPVDLGGGGGDVLAALGNGRLALGQVQSVPAGRYAKAALDHLRLWPELQGRLAPMDNVRAALALVARGEATLGIVYATDARAEVGVKVVATFPAASHPPIVYPVARVTGSSSGPAAALLEHLVSATASASFVAHGFVVLPRAR